MIRANTAEAVLLPSPFEANKYQCGSKRPPPQDGLKTIFQWEAPFFLFRVSDLLLLLFLLFLLVLLIFKLLSNPVVLPWPNLYA